MKWAGLTFLPPAAWELAFWFAVWAPGTPAPPLRKCMSGTRLASATSVGRTIATAIEFLPKSQGKSKSYVNNS